MQSVPCDDIVTPRLSLIAITPDTLLSEQRDDRQLGELIQCSIPPNWPPVDWEPHVLAILLGQFALYPEQIGWHRYVALRRDDGGRPLIGCVGAFWRESSPHECEIGYSILPPHEGLGLATEATAALIGYLKQEPSLTSVIAHTFPHLAGSIRVMEKCGLVFEGAGEEDGTIRYRLGW
jgi:[ribosomal protein S5]-alanine N-acetyltransferase